MTRSLRWVTTMSGGRYCGTGTNVLVCAEQDEAIVETSKAGGDLCRSGAVSEGVKERHAWRSALVEDGGQESSASARRHRFAGVAW